MPRACTVSWSVAGRCHSPVNITLMGRPSAKPGPVGWHHPASSVVSHGKAFWRNAQTWPRNVIVRDWNNAPLWLDIEAPCRKCPACLKKRARMWTFRSLAEIRAAKRTWFGTLTLNPASHYKMLCAATLRMKNAGVLWSELSAEEQFIERCSEIGKEITLMLKRIRKNSNASFRYLVVAEPHKSGLPHYHLLLHEHTEASVPKAALEKEWRLGFSKWKLVPEDAAGRTAWYVSKYLTKGLEARVRASISYGKTRPLAVANACKFDSEKENTFSAGGSLSV